MNGIPKCLLQCRQQITILESSQNIGTDGGMASVPVDDTANVGVA